MLLSSGRMKRPSLSIVVPVFNEEQSLGYVLQDTLENLPKLVRDFEIIVVDDGSRDKTLQIAKSIKRKNPRLRIIHKRHSGFGKALIVGIKSAKKDYVAHMQGNGQDLVRDMVLGIRGKRIDYDLYRFILSYGGFLAYRILFNIKHEDVHWNYVWRTSEIQKLKLDTEGGIFLLVESLIKFERNGLSVGEATAPYRPRFAGVSKVTNYQIVLKTLESMFKLWWQIVTRKI